MQAAVRRSVPSAFTPPPGVILRKVDRVTGRQVSLLCGSDDVVQEAFREGTVLPEECAATVQSGLETVVGWFQKLLR